MDERFAEPAGRRRGRNTCRPFGVTGLASDAEVIRIVEGEKAYLGEGGKGHLGPVVAATGVMLEDELAPRTVQPQDIVASLVALASVLGKLGVGAQNQLPLIIVYRGGGHGPVTDGPLTAYLRLETALAAGRTHFRIDVGHPFLTQLVHRGRHVGAA